MPLPQPPEDHFLAPGDRRLGKKAVARLLSVSESTIKRRDADGRAGFPPSRRIDGWKYWLLSKIIEWAVLAGPEDRLLKRAEVAERIDKSERTVSYRANGRKKDFPAGHYIFGSEKAKPSGRMLRWYESEITHWLSSHR